jgi:sugar lactone lactonase YvrE
LAIDRAGNVRVLNHPSGLARPIAVDEHHDGTILLNGDEVGLLRVDHNGQVSVFNDRLVSFQPPVADFAFSEDGTIYYTCAAPGFESSIVRVDASGTVTTVTRDVGEPAAIDVAPDGSIYYTDYGRGMVCRLGDDGTSVPLLSGLNHPLGLAVDDAGELWVGVAAPGAVGDPDNLDEVISTRIIRFAPGQSPQEAFRLDDHRWPAITFFDIDGEGNLYVPVGARLLVRAPDGRVETIAVGFECLRGARVTRDGRVLLTDEDAGALYRLQKTDGSGRAGINVRP